MDLLGIVTDLKAEVQLLRKEIDKSPSQSATEFLTSTEADQYLKIAKRNTV